MFARRLTLAPIVAVALVGCLGSDGTGSTAGPLAGSVAKGAMISPGATR